MTLAHIKTLVCAVVVISSFFMGAYMKSLQCDRDMAQLREQMQQELNDAQEKARAVTRQLAETSAIADMEAMRNEDNVNSAYDAAVMRVQQSGSTASRSEAGTSATSSTAEPACNCRLYAESRRAYGKLQEEILTITRDCDITAIRYNELYKLHWELRNLIDN